MQYVFITYLVHLFRCMRILLDEYKELDLFSEEYIIY